MVLALKELSIRGDISTTVDYISKLIELNDFVNNEIDTAWLDTLIKENVEGIGAAESRLSRPTNVKINTLNNHTYVVIGATILAFDKCAAGEKQFLTLLDKGQLPPPSLLSMTNEVELILTSVKYKLSATRIGKNVFSIARAEKDSPCVVANVRLLSDGGYLIDIGGKSHVAYLTSKGSAATGMRINIGGANVAFSPDYDPTTLRTDVAGKLVKKLVVDGARVKKGEPYGEIEVMKMFMPLKVEEAGVVSWIVNEGAALAPGDILASLELDNPENVSPATSFSGDLHVFGWGAAFDFPSPKQPHLMFRGAIQKIQGGMAGFVLSEASLLRALHDLESAVTNPTLPMHEVEEQLSVLSGRIPAGLFDQLTSMLKDFKVECERAVGSGVQLR